MKINASLARVHCGVWRQLKPLETFFRSLQGGDSGASHAPQGRDLEEDGIRFLMEDEAGNTVACRVSHEALRDHADRMHYAGTDGAVFERTEN